MGTASPLSLDQWAEAQLHISAAKMAESVSATSLVKHRPGFGQTVRPVRGSVLAAPGVGESEPDYFFHWLRDSAAIMDAALVLIRNGIDAEGWKQRFADFVRFSLDLSRISGRRLLAETDMRSRTAPDMQQFLRPDEEIAAVDGENVLGEVRYNADGTLDFLRWNRPQHDGPAFRALACLRYLDAGAIADGARDAVVEQIRVDLDYTAKHAGEPCYDLWEEEIARHHYTCLVQFAALQGGALWVRADGQGDYAARLDAAAQRLRQMLDGFWSPGKGYYLSRVMPAGGTMAKELDSAVILGVLHAGLASGPHSVEDDRVAATLDRLGERFAADYAINRQGAAGLAFGRYPGDSYVSGGAWFICTFGAAEFCYKRAAVRKDISLLARGDAMLGMARQCIPATGEMSEQFDQTTGEQTSARNLAWSYAAFITAWQARADALQTIGKR